MYNTLKIIPVLLTIGITACGGGGGGGGAGGPSEPQSVNRQAQAPLEFGQHEVTKLTTDSPFINSISGGSGSGAIAYSSSNTDIATIDTVSGAVSIVGAGSTTITAVKEADDNYLSTSASYALRVEKAQQEPLAFEHSDIIKLTVDPAFIIPYTGGSGSGTVNYSSSNALVAAVNQNSGEVSIVGSGVTTITVIKAEDDTYLGASASYSLIVNKTQQVPLVFEFNKVAKQAIDPPFTNPVTGGSGSGLLSYSSSNPDVATINQISGEVSIVGEGATFITVRKEKDSTYLNSSASYELTVDRAQQASLDFELANITVQTIDPPFTNPVTGGSGSGTLSYSSSDTGVATVNEISGEVSITGPGVTTISATKGEDAIYHGASASYELTVGRAQQAPLVFEHSDITKETIDEPFINSVTGGSGSGSLSYTSSDISVATVNTDTGEVSILGAGSTTIILTKTEDSAYLSAFASYELQVDKAQQTSLVFEQSYIDKEAIDPPFTNPVTGGSGSGSLRYSSSDGSVATVNDTGEVSIIGAGTTTITVMKAEDSAYLGASTSYDLRVEKSQQAPLVFEHQGIIKETIDEPFTNSVTGGSGSGSLNYSSSNGAVANINAVTGEVFITGAGITTITVMKAEDGAYLGASASYDLQVNKAQQTPLAFEQSEVAKEASGWSFFNPITGGSGYGAMSYSSSNSSVATVNGGSGQVSITGAGTTTITATKAEDNTYLSTSAAYTLTVTKIEQQPLTFDQSSITRSTADGPFIVGLTGGSGTGIVSYSSDDSAIATVDSATGQITPVGAGMATISAVNPGDENYNSSSASLIVEVLVPDGVAPEAVIIFPWRQSIAQRDTLTVRGIATDSSGIRSVSVNGAEATLTSVEDNPGKVEWELQIQGARADLEVVVAVTDVTGEVNERADYVNLIAPTTVPMNFSLDESRQRIIALNTYSLDINYPDIIEYDLVNGVQRLLAQSPGTITCLDASTDSWYSTFRTGASYSFRRTSLSSDQVDEVLYNQPYSIGSIQTMLCDPARNSLYFLASPSEEELWTSRIYELNLTTSTWATIYESNSTADRLNDIRLSGTDIIAVTSISPTGDSILLALSTTDGSTRNLYENTEYAARVVAGSSADDVYIVTYDGIVHFNTVEKTGIRIGYDVADGPLEFSQLRDAALDAVNARVIIADESLRSLIAVDLNSGERSIVLTESVGDGQKLIYPRYLVLNEAGTKAYVIDDGFNAAEKVVEVDLLTGNRTVLGDINGEYNYSVKGIALDEGNGFVYAVADNIVYKININSGDTEIVASDSIGIGAAYIGISAVTLDKVHNRLLLADAVTEAIFGMDLDSGVRSIVSRAGERGSGPGFENINSLALDSQRNVVYVANQLNGSIQEVDLDTGDRSTLQPKCADALAEPEQLLYNLDFDFFDNSLLVRTDDIFTTAIDLATGECSYHFRYGLTRFYDFAVVPDDLVLAVTRRQLLLIDKRSEEYVVISE